MSAFDKHISIEYPDERTSIITLKLSNNQKEEVNQERNGSYITFLIFTAILLVFFIPFTILNEDTWAILIIPVILIWICYSSTIKHYVKFSTRTKQIIIDGHIQRIKVAYNRVSTKKEKEIEQIFLLNKPLNQIRKIYTHQHFGSTSDYYCSLIKTGISKIVEVHGIDTAWETDWEEEDIRKLTALIRKEIRKQKSRKVGFNKKGVYYDLPLSVLEHKLRLNKRTIKKIESGKSKKYLMPSFLTLTTWILPFCLFVYLIYQYVDLIFGESFGNPLIKYVVFGLIETFLFGLLIFLIIKYGHSYLEISKNGIKYKAPKEVDFSASYSSMNGIYKMGREFNKGFTKRLVPVHCRAYRIFYLTCRDESPRKNLLDFSYPNADKIYNLMLYFWKKQKNPPIENPSPEGYRYKDGYPFFESIFRATKELALVIFTPTLIIGGYLFLVILGIGTIFAVFSIGCQVINVIFQLG